MERRLIAADKLISGLSSENERWGCKRYNTNATMSLTSPAKICLFVSFSSLFLHPFVFPPDSLYYSLFSTIPTQVGTRFGGVEAAACASPGWLSDLCCFPELWRGLQLGLQERNDIPNMGKWRAGQRHPFEPAFQTGKPSDRWGRNQQVRRSGCSQQILKFETEKDTIEYEFVKSNVWIRHVVAGQVLVANMWICPHFGWLRG